MNHEHRRRKIPNQNSEQSFNRVIEGIFPKLRKEGAHSDLKKKKKKVTYNTTRQVQKRIPIHHITVKILNIQNKDRILQAAKEKPHVTYTSKSIRITADLSKKILKSEVLELIYLEYVSKSTDRPQTLSRLVFCQLDTNQGHLKTGTPVKKIRPSDCLQTSLQGVFVVVIIAH